MHDDGPIRDRNGCPSFSASPKGLYPSHVERALRLNDRRQFTAFDDLLFRFGKLRHENMLKVRNPKPQPAKTGDCNYTETPGRRRPEG